MSTQWFYLHMQLKFTTINTWQRGRESAIFSSKCTLFQEDSTSQAVLKLSSVQKKQKFWGVLVPMVHFWRWRMNGPSALSPFWGALELIIPSSRFSCILWLPGAVWVSSPSRMCPLVYSVRAELWALVRADTPHSPAGVLLGEGVRCSVDLQERK